MRTSLTFLSGLVLLAACSDDTSTTAPASRVVSSASSAQTTQLAYPPGPSAPAAAAGKPSAGFSTVTAVTSLSTHIDGIAWTSGAAVATCPAGSVVIAGGHEFTYGSNYAHIVSSLPLGTNAWRVLVSMDGAAASDFTAKAMCVQ